MKIYNTAIVMPKIIAMTIVTIYIKLLYRINNARLSLKQIVTF